MGRDGPRSIPINGAGGGLWLSLGAPMAVLGSGAVAGSAGQYAGEDNRGPGRCDSVGRLGSYRRRQAEGGYNHDLAKRESAPGSRLVFNALSPHSRGPEDDKDGQETWFTARIASLIG